MLQPTRTKYRKAHKGRIHGRASRCNAINYGAFALKAMTPERIIGKQIEAARVALTRYMKRQYFQIYQFQKSQLKLEWVKVKDHLNIGPVELNQVEFYLKLMVYLKK
jgi:ribosomal protein L16/L10AE